MINIAWNPFQTIFILLQVEFSVNSFDTRSTVTFFVTTETFTGMCSVKDAIKNFKKFTGKHLCQGIFFSKVAGWRQLLKKILWHRCFAVNCRIFKKTSFHRTPPVAASVTKKNLTQQASTCSKLAINEINVQGAALDLFKVHNKSSRTTSFDVP